ncbi:MAG: hypothetical protein AAGE52_19640 [Myxococcota bacterium]
MTLWVSATSVGEAQPRRIELRVDACTAEWVASQRLRRLLRVELRDGDEAWDVTASPEAMRLRVEAIACDRDAELRITAAASGRFVERVVDLRDTAPEARPRVLALLLRDLHRALLAVESSPADETGTGETAADESRESTDNERTGDESTGDESTGDQGMGNEGTGDESTADERTVESGDDGAEATGALGVPDPGALALEDEPFPGRDLAGSVRAPPAEGGPSAHADRNEGTPPRSASRAAQDAARRTRLELALSAPVIRDGPEVFLGGRIAFATPLGESGRFAIAAEGLVRRGDDALGQIRMGVALLSASVGVVRGVVRTGVVEVAGDLELAAGLAHARSTDAGASSFLAVTALRGELAWRPTASIRLMIQLGAGIVLQGAEALAETRRVVGYSGVYFPVRAGVGIDL